MRNILIFARKNSRVTIFIYNNSTLFYTSLYVRQHAKPTRFDCAESWVILSDIEQRIKAKIEAIGTPLKDWNIQINYGIKTGFNDAFIIDGEKRAELIAKDPKSAEIIRPILRGKDIKRYGYDFADLYLINTHNGVKEKGIKRINIEDYPAIKAHLDSYYPQLEARADQGDTPYNLRNCAYIEDFSKQKIIYPNMTKYMPFLLDNEGFCTNQKCFIVTGESLPYLTAFFNSNIFKICYRDNFPELLGGTRELSKVFFEQVKIPNIQEIEKIDFETFVEDVQKGEDNASLRLERALMLALDLQEYEEYILSYNINSL